MFLFDFLAVSGLFMPLRVVCEERGRIQRIWYLSLFNSIILSFILVVKSSNQAHSP